MFDQNNIEHLAVSDNYRTKIIVGLKTKTKPLIDSYSDKITNNKLLSFINNFIILCQKHKIKNLVNGHFQKSHESDECGVIVTIESIETFDLSLIDVYSELGAKIFGINIFNKHKSKSLTKVTYLSTDTTFTEGLYHYRMDSFTQAYTEINTFIHSIVKFWIEESKIYNYIGIGGESFYYSQFKKFQAIKNFNRHITRHEMDNANVNYMDIKSDNYLIDLKKEQLTDYLSPYGEWLMLINSRKGLQSLADQVINESAIQEIIYIVCCVENVKQDMDILLKIYHIYNHKKIRICPGLDKYIVHLIYLKRK